MLMWIDIFFWAPLYSISNWIYSISYFFLSYTIFFILFHFVFFTYFFKWSIRKIVEDDHLETLAHQGIHQMRTDEPCPASNQDFRFIPHQLNS